MKWRLIVIIIIENVALKVMDATVYLGDEGPSRTVGFNLPAEASAIPESSDASQDRRRSLRRTLSKSMRGNLRTLSIHHLRNVQVEELAADIIQDIVGGDNLVDVDSIDKSTSYQQFKYLESKSEIRCLTRPMRDKRKIKMLLENYESTQATLRLNSFSLKSKINWHRFWHSTSRSHHRFGFNPWFKSIEGKLGTGGSSFFRFVTSMAILDLFVLCLVFFFLLLPQIVHWGSFLAAGGNQTSFSGYLSNLTFSGRELILGDGLMSDTQMYYGHYTHFITRLYSFNYNLKMAYFLVTCVALFCALVALCVMFSRAFKYSYYNTKGGISHVDANLIFSAWDFNTKEVKMAELCSNNVFLDLKILAAELQRKKQTFGWSKRVRMVLMMIGIEILILALMATSPTAIYFACDRAGEHPTSLGFKLGIPLLLTSFNCLVPKFFSELGRAERWRSSRTSSYLIVIRSSCLQSCNLGVLVYYWFSHLACSTHNVQCTAIRCWETFVGTQLYTLVILNLLFDVTITGIQLIRRYLHKILTSKVKPKCLVLLEAMEFDVGRTSVDVVYIQCLLWLSMYFSPLLVIPILLKLVITFCLKKVMASFGCYEPVKVWRLGHLETLIRLIHLITFLLCLSAYIYTIVYVTPSRECGPFRSHCRPYEIFESSFMNDSFAIRDSLRIIVKDVFSSVGFRAYICIIFGIIVNYMRVHAHGRHGFADQLKRQIELESKDRCYYLDTLKILRNYMGQGKSGEPADIAKKRRPGINYLVEGSQAKQVSSASMQSLNASPLTPCMGPDYWPPESRHMVTSDLYNVMFPNKRISSRDLGDKSPAGNIQRTQPSPDICPLPDEVDRLFDFEKGHP